MASAGTSRLLGGWAVRHVFSLLLVVAIVSLTVLLVHRGDDLLQTHRRIPSASSAHQSLEDAATDPMPSYNTIAAGELTSDQAAIAYVPAAQQVFLHEQVMVEDIRSNYLKPPSFEPYNLKNNIKKDPSRGQTKVILEALNNMRDGFFVECGALDGETRSNTLFMERSLGWTGLLVEADPSNFAKVLSKRRNAWSTNVCLNSRNSKSQVRFKPAFNVGKIAAANASGTVEVDCFPLHALLLALNVTRVDYFSLDVEGAELDVLNAVPFDRIDIRTLSVEFAHTTGGGKPALRAFMEARGYTVIREVKQADWTANDFIFVKNDTFSEEQRLRLARPYRA